LKKEDTDKGGRINRTEVITALDMIISSLKSAVVDLEQLCTGTNSRLYQDIKDYKIDIKKAEEVLCAL